MYVKLALADHIRLNQPLPWDVLDENGMVLLTRGTVPSDLRQLNALIERGAYVDQDAFERHRKTQQVAAARPLDIFEQWDDLHLRLGNLLRRHEREAEFITRIGVLTGELMTLVAKEQDIAMFQAMRMDKASYSVAHSLQVAVCCDVYGHFLQLAPEARAMLIKAALTMNLCIIDLQQTLSRQAGPLTPQQRAQMQIHPLAARDRLEQMGVTDPVWLRAVAEHHETCDGKGYPNGIAQVATEAEVINVLDRYCAVMTHRRDREGKPANVVARELYLATTGSLQEVVARVIKSFGLFPPGRFVRLANGEIALVTHRGGQANKPRVGTLISAQGVKLMDPIRRDTSEADYAITHIVPDEDCAIQVDPSKLFGIRRRD
jgi:HD-GYP domain-containing protein (c-di-GMP phosphodiesterase class II)